MHTVDMPNNTRLRERGGLKVREVIDTASTTSETNFITGTPAAGGTKRALDVNVLDTVAASGTPTAANQEVTNQHLQIASSPQRLEVANATTIYEGRTADRTASGTSIAKWQILRQTIQGLQTVREFANNSLAFDKIWDNRASLFNASSFINQYSIQFDGANDFINVPHSSTISFDRLNAFTINCWIKSTVTANCSYVDKLPAAIGYALYLSSSRLTLEFAASGTNRIRVRTATNVTYNDGNWHHIAATYSGGSIASGIKLYIDGASQSLDVQNDTLTLTTANALPLSIGSRSGGGSNYTGFIDEVSIFDVELSATGITAIYNGGVPTNLATHANAVSRRAWWRMGDGATFPTIPDVVGGNTGTMNNQVAGNIITVVPP